jgi:hypothetical protein
VNRIFIVLLTSFYATAGWAAGSPKHKITNNQAKALVMATLTTQQRRLPKLEAVPDDTPGSSSQFMFFTVTWEGTPNGSVVVGNYAVDPYTGDVFSATRECYEEKNKRLAALQTQIRAKLHLSHSQYQKLKTKGPLCAE